MPTPVLRRREEEEDIQSLTLGLATDYLYPALRKTIPLGLRLLLSDWVQSDFTAVHNLHSFDIGAETQVPEHAYTVRKYSPTSALCKHLSVVV